MTTSRADIDDFLAQRRIAMVGVSRDPKDFSRQLFREMCRRGYDMVPVNLFAEELEGRECFQCLQVVRPKVDGVLLMTPFWDTERMVHDCAELGIPRVWMYRAQGRGAVNPEAIEFCKSHEIRVSEGCPFMFLPATGVLHRAHGFLLKLAKKYPAAA
jgi:predicted CoA-binding protein